MDGVIRIDRVAQQLEVWLDQSFPFAKIKVKVLGRTSGDFLAIANASILNLVSREPEYISGLGTTIDEAVHDLFVRFVEGVRQHTPRGGLTEADFEWASAQDF